MLSTSSNHASAHAGAAAHPSVDRPSRTTRDHSYDDSPPPGFLRLLWTPQTSERPSSMRGSAKGSAGAHVQLRVMAPSSVGRIRLAQRRRCPSRPARAPRTGLYLWLRRDPDMTVLTIRDRLSVVP